MHRLFTFFILSLSVSCHFGPGSGKSISTPREFLNIATPNVQVYGKDKRIISEQLQVFLATKTESFYSKEYFDSTDLIIDTILYSPDFNKIALFVMTKNPTYRLRYSEKTDPWYYNSYCYLGKRQNDTLNLAWLTRMSLGTFYDFKEIKKGIRRLYFTEFATLQNTDGTYTYKYNLNDKRFWECPVWTQYYN